MEPVRNFCHLCGSKLIKHEEDGGSWECSQCGNRIYVDPHPAVDAVLCNDEGEVLLCVRGREPRKGFLNMPGGFMAVRETVEEAIARELLEELGVKPEDHTPFEYVTSTTIEYPSKLEVGQVVVMVFAAKLHRTDLVAQDDIESFVWRKPASLTADEISHGQKELDAVLQGVAELGL
jgi:NAD+ diphosphatase